MITRHYAWGLVVLLCAAVPVQGEDAAAGWFTAGSDAYPALPEGRGGAFIGTHNDAVIVAGGSTFDRPGWEGGAKQFHDDIFVLVKDADGQTRWRDGFKLPQPRAHGATVSTPHGVICLGGENSDGVRDDALLIEWNAQSQQIVVRELTVRLPAALKDAAAAYLDTDNRKHVYLAGGATDSGESSDLFARIALDRLLARQADNDGDWRRLTRWPGEPRFGAAMVTQFDGFKRSIYLMGGKNASSGDYLTDAYRYEPTRERWIRVADLPRPALLAPHVALGQSHILLASGSDGRDAPRWRELQHEFDFDAGLLLYHTITDTWVDAGSIDIGVAGAAIVPFHGDYLIPGGELRPTVRTATVQSLQLKPAPGNFGALDYTMLGLYLAAMMVIGFYFAKNGRNTDDFFLGGKRIPWWAAGLSLMATQVSAIGFMATPAKTFATDWLYFAGVATWFIVVPIATLIFVPFFCKLNITSAYEYLEVRFNLLVRVLAALLYCLLQLGRIAIVLYLPALALSAVVGLDVWLCIAIMGALATVYTAAGGMEAVVWTDVAQAVVLLGGAAVCIALVLFGIEDGPGRFIDIAFTDHKFRWADLRWDYTAPVLWVILVGNVATRLANLISDQSIVQRYLSTADAKQAKRALWTDVAVSVPWAILIFMLGTALYVYYKVHPERIAPALEVDGVVPFFIAHQVPAGVSGLIVAAIFAASMSSFDSAVHSVATVIMTDFYQRFRAPDARGDNLGLARWITIALGTIGTASALAVASSDVKSVWDLFIEILGLGIGLLAGLFMLGALSRRGNGHGAVVGLFTGVLTLYIVKYHTDISFWLYTPIGLVVCWSVGYLASLLRPMPVADIQPERTSVSRM